MERQNMRRALACKRRQAAVLALAFLHVSITSTHGQETSRIYEERYRIDTASRTIQICGEVAKLANRGVRALRAADLLGRKAPINLRNDGRLVNVLREDQGTAHLQVLTDKAGNRVTYGSREDYSDEGGVASEIVVVRVGGRIWEIAWYIEETAESNGTPILHMATDGAAVCRFRTVYQPPMLKLLSGGDPSKVSIYRSILNGHSLVPPSAGLDSVAVEAASSLNNPDYGTGLYSVNSLSWRVDLLNQGRPMSLIQIHFRHQCDKDLIGFVQNGRIIRTSLLFSYAGDKLAPLSRASLRLRDLLSCAHTSEFPVLGRDRRAYVLLTNEQHVRLLFGFRFGLTQPVARLFWQASNQVIRHPIRYPH